MLFSVLLCSARSPVDSDDEHEDGGRGVDEVEAEVAAGAEEEAVERKQPLLAGREEQTQHTHAQVEQGHEQNETLARGAHTLAHVHIQHRTALTHTRMHACC